MQEELQRKLDEINEEQALARVQSWVDTSLDDSKDSTGASVAMSAEEKAAADGRSVYVGNVRHLFIEICSALTVFSIQKFAFYFYFADFPIFLHFTEEPKFF